jgi:flavin-dependent dehydrogenase
MTDSTDFDVVICGGGLAGLTLARQLKLELPELSVAVVDRLTRPLPEAAFKVGESSIELGTHYFGQVLKLDKYFRERHLPKLGLRFFMGKSQGPIETRPETGLALFPPFPSYQIDRGRLENDLRNLVSDMGVELFEGAVVDNILLAEGEEKHIIECRRKDDGSGFSLTGRWVVDALGRRRLLQSKLGLKRAHAHQASAAWWRYKGRIDVEDLAPEDAHKWRDDSIEDRYYSTNHLMNKGYWVWLIPLGSDATSVGIVTDETIHPQASYGQSFDQALDWLAEHEPVLYEYLRDRRPLDFLSLKNYSYASAQVFSHRRWSCVGEAGFFLDPFYSVGSDFIAMGNTITVEMIRRERAGELTEEAVGTLNRLVLDILFPICLANYQGTYRVFGHPQIFTPKLAWDSAIYWAFSYQVYAQGLIRRPPPEIFALGERYRDLNSRVQQLFKDWSENAPPRAMYVRGDMTRMHFLQLLFLDLGARRSQEQVFEIMSKNLDRFEELAQVLFWQAVQECYPEHAALKQRPWVNAWRITLAPEKWAEEGLFEPATAPRPLGPMRDNFTGIFAPQSLRERLSYNLPFNILHWGKGFVHYRVVPPLSRWLIENKSAMWTRKIFVRDYPSRPRGV